MVFKVKAEKNWFRFQSKVIWEKSDLRLEWWLYVWWCWMVEVLLCYEPEWLYIIMNYGWLQNMSRAGWLTMNYELMPNGWDERWFMAENECIYAELLILWLLHSTYLRYEFLWVKAVASHHVLQVETWYSADSMS